MKVINKIRRDVELNHPLIHCITNPISINQCANALLAVGARPIMAEHPHEVGEITVTAKALLLNLGNITDVRMESMGISLKTAKDNHLPVILDAVGIACSRLRRNFVSELLNIAVPTVIKGNYSEINALYHGEYRSAGVDADASLGVNSMDRAAAELARKYHTIILASGKTDIVTDGSRLIHINNGTGQLSTITGTGCMLGALCAAYMSVEADIEAVVTACAVLGIAGELSETDVGSGTFMVNLMDILSVMKDAQLEKYLDKEEISIEDI